MGTRQSTPETGGVPTYNPPKTLRIYGESTTRLAQTRNPLYSCILQKVVDYMNVLRARHGANPLILSDELSKGAQTNIESIKCKQVHEHDDDVGQNLSWTWGSSLDGTKSAEDVVQQLNSMVQGWYDEKDLYAQQGLSRDEYYPQTGHFTQLVWKDSTEVGLGFTMSEKDGLPCLGFAANFKSRGNVRGSFGANVSL